jgi:ligand-binding sensor domain-containing protein
MYQDKSGNMWWGTGQGLYRFDGKQFYQVKQKGPWKYKQWDMAKQN